MSLEKCQQKSDRSSGAPKARVVLQQCLSAKLQIQPASDEQEAEYVEIGHGLIVYVCFMKGSTEETVDQMVKSLLNVRLSEKDGKLVSILDLPGDVLIIPQATLGGNMKGKCMQYHKNIAKEDGLHLYLRFTSVCCDIIQQNSKDSQGSNIVKNGTYGNRQVLSTITNGPFTHLLEFM